jgi:tetratricopeptide (TPR) repeat protein
LALADMLDRNGQSKEAAAIAGDVAEHSHDPHVHARRGHFLGRIGDIAGAQAALRRALELAPGDAGHRLTLADMLERGDKVEEALGIARALVAEGSRDPHVHARLGHFLIRTGDLKAAEGALRRAIELAPSVPHYQVALADVFERSGKTEEAISVIQALLEEEDRNPHLHARLAHLFSKLEDFKRAEIALRRAIEIAPADPAIGRTLASVLDRQDRVEEAVAVIQKLVVNGDRDEHTFGWLAHLLARIGHLDAAEAVYRQVIDIAPGVASYRLSLADILDRIGRKEEAVAIVQAMISDNDHDPHLYARLGHLLSQIGDLEGAECALNRAVAIAPDEHGFGRALAAVLDRMGRTREALLLIETLVAKGSVDEHTLGWFGHLLSRSGAVDKAETIYRKAIEIAPKETAFHLSLADVLDRQNRTDEAIAMVQNLISDGARDRHTYGRLGHLLARIGDVDGAQAASRQAAAMAS